MKTRIFTLIGIVLPSLFGAQAQDTNQIRLDSGQVQTQVQTQEQIQTQVQEQTQTQEQIQGETRNNISQNTAIVQPFQVTLITPFGTNGFNSAQSVNYFSWNVIAGYNGGLDGLEIGGFANVLQNDMKGTQIAGFSNIVRQNMQGIQVAGFSNSVGGNAEGIMIAGFTNQLNQNSQAIQIAGFSNQAMGTLKGAQLAGFANVTKDSIVGLQAAGFANYASKSSTAVQVSGFINIIQGDLTGAQIAGFANSADNIEGTQISGFVNNAKSVNGFQIGFINIADSFTNGFPIGFISTVKNGYRNISIGANEMQYAELQYRTGVARFHNIFSGMIGPIPGHNGWAFGYGVGSAVIDKPKNDVIIDLVFYHVNEDQIWTDAFNNLTRLSARYSFHPTGKRFGVWAAPALNFQVYSKEDWYGDTFESHLAPYTFLTDQSRYAKFKMWAGLSAGFSF